MTPETTQYQLATLAARIAPQLCADRSQQRRAVYLALSLIDVSAEILDEQIAQIKKDQGYQATSERITEFRERYNLKGGYINYRRAATVITGHAEDRHVSLAVRIFEKLLMEHEDPFDTEGKRRLARDAEVLNRYHTSGVPMRDVVSWRMLAENLGVCAKKLLTGDLRELPQKPAGVSEK